MNKPFSLTAAVSAHVLSAAAILAVCTAFLPACGSNDAPSVAPKTEVVAEVIQPRFADAGMADAEIDRVDHDSARVAMARPDVPSVHKTPEAPALEVLDLAIARDIYKRVPEGVSTEFTLDDGTLWGYIKVKNLGAGR